MFVFVICKVHWLKLIIFSDASFAKCATFESGMPFVIPGQVYGKGCTIWARSKGSYVTGSRHSCRCGGSYNGTKGLFLLLHLCS